VQQTVARRQELQRRMRQAASMGAAVRDSVITASQRFERNQELEADRAGALYILRIGYEVQDAIDLFDSMDRDERQSRQWRNQITWLGGHPRASERVAELEIARGRLKLLQRDYDDAIALIEANELPDSALAMLDRVLEAFPTMAAANHARAVVLAQQWLNGADPSELRVRPAMPAYDARFMGAIRGSNPNQGAAARRPAREAFQKVFTRDAHPYSLANLAVLEAYDGEMAGAIEKVNLAAERAPRDPFVANNQGVVLFLANRNAEARAAFTRAEQAAGNQVPRQVIFNQARIAAAMGDREAAVRYANRYLQMDSRSNWAREAQQLVTANGGTPAATTAPTTANVAPPNVAGVEFGAQRSRVIGALGEPDGGAANAGAVWRYPARGMAIAFDDEGTVKMIIVESRNVGAVGGVTVGDSWANVTRALGNPHLEQQTANGMMYKWNRGSWSLATLVKDGAVLAIGAARN
jgi:predicted Zn-dependent protease